MGEFVLKFRLDKKQRRQKKSRKELWTRKKSRTRSRSYPMEAAEAFESIVISPAHVDGKMYRLLRLRRPVIE